MLGSSCAPEQASVVPPADRAIWLFGRPACSATTGRLIADPVSQAKTAIAPLDRVKILFQAQNPEFQKYSGRWTGVFTAAASIVSTQGPAALFQGHSATLLRIFPYAAIKYMAYDKLHFVSGAAWLA